MSTNIAHYTRYNRSFQIIKLTYVQVFAHWWRRELAPLWSYQISLNKVFFTRLKKEWNRHLILFLTPLCRTYWTTYTQHSPVQGYLSWVNRLSSNKLTLIDEARCWPHSWYALSRSRKTNSLRNDYIMLRTSPVFSIVMVKDSIFQYNPKHFLFA